MTGSTTQKHSEGSQRYQECRGIILNLLAAGRCFYGYYRKKQTHQNNRCPRIYGQPQIQAEKSSQCKGAEKDKKRSNTRFPGNIDEYGQKYKQPQDGLFQNFPPAFQRKCPQQS